MKRAKEFLVVDVFHGMGKEKLSWLMDKDGEQWIVRELHLSSPNRDQIHRFDSERDANEFIAKEMARVGAEIVLDMLDRYSSASLYEVV